MVYSDGVIAAEFAYAVQRTAYGRRQKVPYMKRFCYIDGRIVYADGFSVAFQRRQSVIFVPKPAHYFLCHGRAVKIKIEISSRYRCLFYKGVFL